MGALLLVNSSAQRHRPTRRCSGRTTRHKIGAILERDSVPITVPISGARR